MSLNAYGDDKGAMGAGGGAGALSQAPRLRAGCYAAWKPDMDVYLARIGATAVRTLPSLPNTSQPFSATPSPPHLRIPPLSHQPTIPQHRSTVATSPRRLLRVDSGETRAEVC